MTTYRLRVRDHAPHPRDVVVRAEDQTPVGDVVAALADLGFPRSHPRIEGRLTGDDATLADVGVTHGDVIELGVAEHEPLARAPGRYLVAVAGPRAGSWWPLPPTGSVVVGRERTTDVHLADPLVSGRHARIEVGTDGVTVEDLDSSNGTLHEGEPLTGTAPLEPGSYAQVGSTVLTVVEVGPGDLPTLPRAKEGARPFQRHFRAAQPPLPGSVKAPKPPGGDDGSSGRQWWRYLLPIVTGGGFALMTGRVWFLAIIAIAPIVMFVDAMRTRKREGREKVEREAAYEQALAEHRREVASVRTVEQRRRRNAAVGGGEAVLMAELRHERLWERTATDEDHLEVCLGLASQPSTVTSDGDPDDDGTDLWGVPLNVSLPSTGSLLVAGARGRARAVARSLLLNLATTHSPAELHVVVLTTDARPDDWDWVRWLPHAFLPEGAVDVHVDAEQRDAALTAVLRRLDARAEAAREQRGGTAAPPRPAVVVVVDGVAGVDGDRLTTLLTRGPEVAIHGIVLDPVVVPEGVRGTLTLGEHPDEGSFTSHAVATVDGVLTAELAPVWADRAARRMAGLRPAAADEGGGTVAEVHLTDLVAPDGVDADWVRRRWERTSPREQVVVGLAGRTPIEVDIVGHGPHAIVGGATRSGKTEYLMTWLTSLCLDNTPDDLAVIVADFKGGVDHVQTAKLPHVVALVTNEDIRAFERTLVMIEAEIERRQDLLRTAGASNIEAYRTARQRDPSLLALPRLLVVVDEFSELRRSDREGGGGYMGRLESVARVGAGLGVHLVLVTQNFSGGQLSDQIDGQVGLGVCFRVEDDEHSQVVLRSKVASSIPASRPGRAWARLRGLDLVEFQSARVAGRRRDLAAADTTVDAELAPFETLPVPAARAGGGAAPHDETDLALLIDVLREATDGGPPIPWPDELPPDLRLATAVRRHRDEGRRGTPVGLADVPEKQQQVVATLGPDDEQVLVVGTDGGAMAEVLATIAVGDALTHPPDRRQLHVVDLEGTSLEPLEALPHVGAVASLDEDLAVRIVRSLLEEAARRRALFEQAGTGDIDEYERVAEPLPRVRLLLNGAHRLRGSAEAEASQLLRPVAALAADATGTGIELVLAGGPSIVGRRMTRRATRRFVLRMPDSATYANVGAPRSRAPDLEHPGRAWDTVNDQLVQFGAVASDAVLGDVLDELGRRLREHHAGVPVPQALPEVRWPLPWSRLDLDALQPPSGYRDALPLGVDTDAARWRWVDAGEDGPLIAVGGDGRTGRSAVLVGLARLARQLGWAVQGVAPTRRSAVRLLAREGIDVVADLDALRPPGRARTLVVVDDAHRLDDDGEVLGKLIEVATGPLLIVLAGPIDEFGRRTGLLRGVPDIRVAVTLAPRMSTGTGNVRVPEEHRVDPRPGRGILSAAGEITGVQFPLPPELA